MTFLAFLLMAVGGDDSVFVQVVVMSGCLASEQTFIVFRYSQAWILCWF